jgi:hypothetical protein
MKLKPSEITSILEYLAFYGEFLSNDIIGEDNLLVKGYPTRWPHKIKIIENKAYLYGVGAQSRDEYESGNTLSILIPDEILNNSLFQRRVCEMALNMHNKLGVILKKCDPSSLAEEQELYNKLILNTVKSVNSTTRK